MIRAETLGELVGDALRRRLPATHKKGFLAQIQVELDCKSRHAEALVYEDACRAFADFANLCAWLGPTFGNEVAAAWGHVMAHRDDAAVVEDANALSETFAALRAVNQVSGAALETVSGRLRKAAE